MNDNRRPRRPDQPADELDRQIRDLLGDVVAATPVAPELAHPEAESRVFASTRPSATPATPATPATAPATGPGHGSRGPNEPNRWIIGGGIGLGVAAAVIALFVIPNIGDPEVVRQVPATDVTIADTTTPDTTTPVTAVVATDPSGTVETGALEPTPSTTAPVDVSAADPDTNDALTSVPQGDAASPPAGAMPTPGEPESITATPDGIIVEVPPVELGDGVTNEFPPTFASGIPTRIAVSGADGSIYFEPLEPADPANPIMVLDGETDELRQLDVPGDPGRTIRLLDAAEVQGATTLLYIVEENIEAPLCTGLEDPECLESIRTFVPSSGAATTVVEQTAWEVGWGSFQIADNGLIIGTGWGLDNHGPEFYNISTGTTPTPASLGLEVNYGGCDDCPASYTIDRPGEHIAWIEGAAPETMMVIVELATGARVEVPVDPLTTRTITGNLQLTDVDVAAIAAGRYGGYATYSRFGNDQSIWIDLATGVGTPQNELPRYDVNGIDTAGGITTLS